MTTASNTSAADWAGRWGKKPLGIYHNKGVATLDALTYYPATGAGSTSTGFIGAYGRSAGGSYGAPSATLSYSKYTSGTSTTRAVWAAAQGHQLAVIRSVRGIGAEVWINFDMKFPSTDASSLSGYTPSSWGMLFKWGDVEIGCKETTYTSTQSFVFTIRNNGVEVATLTLPGVATTQADTAAAGWSYCSLHVKLDASTGLIEFAIDGVAQSVAYTGQNTITTTSLASATAIYFGPPVLDNGTTAYVGQIDNFHVDDAAYTSGRISVSLISYSGTDFSVTNAAGYPSGSFANAVANMTDGLAGRFTAAGGRAVLSSTAPSLAQLAGFLTEVIGFEIIAKRVSSRNPINARRLQLGVQVSGVDYLGNDSKALALPFSAIGTPPETAGITTFEQIFEKSAGVRFNTTEAGSALLKIVFVDTTP